MTPVFSPPCHSRVSLDFSSRFPIFGGALPFRLLLPTPQFARHRRHRRLRQGRQEVRTSGTGPPVRRILTALCTYQHFHEVTVNKWGGISDLNDLVTFYTGLGGEPVSLCCIPAGRWGRRSRLGGRAGARRNLSPPFKFPLNLLADSAI